MYFSILLCLAAAVASGQGAHSDGSRGDGSGGSSGSSDRARQPPDHRLLMDKIEVSLEERDRGNLTIPITMLSQMKTQLLEIQGLLSKDTGQDSGKSESGTDAQTDNERIDELLLRLNRPRKEPAVVGDSSQSSDSLISGSGKVAAMPENASNDFDTSPFDGSGGDSEEGTETQPKLTANTSVSKSMTLESAIAVSREGISIFRPIPPVAESKAATSTSISDSAGYFGFSATAPTLERITALSPDFFSDFSNGRRQPIPPEGAIGTANRPVNLEFVPTERIPNGVIHPPDTSALPTVATVVNEPGANSAGNFQGRPVLDRYKSQKEIETSDVMSKATLESNNPPRIQVSGAYNVPADMTPIFSGLASKTGSGAKTVERTETTDTSSDLASLLKRVSGLRGLAPASNRASLVGYR